MKFARLLRDAIPQQPELDNLFQTYKHLKKLIKKFETTYTGIESIASTSGIEQDVERAEDSDIESQPTADKGALALTHDDLSSHGSRTSKPGEGLSSQPSSSEPRQPTSGGEQEEPQEAFVRAINHTLHTFNRDFQEREEAAMMWRDQLEEACSVGMTLNDAYTVRESLRQFHAEASNLHNWSTHAYTLLQKAFKKHLKRAGYLPAEPTVESIVSQPFCSTERLSSMLRRAEELLNHMETRVENLRVSCSEAQPDQRSGGTAQNQRPSRPLNVTLVLGIGEHATGEDRASTVQPRVQSSSVRPTIGGPAMQTTGIGLELGLGTGQPLGRLEFRPGAASAMPDLNMEADSDNTSKRKRSQDISYADNLDDAPST